MSTRRWVRALKYNSQNNSCSTVTCAGASACLLHMGSGPHMSRITRAACSETLSWVEAVLVWLSRNGLFGAGRTGFWRLGQTEVVRTGSEYPDSGDRGTSGQPVINSWSSFGICKVFSIFWKTGWSFWALRLSLAPNILTSRSLALFCKYSYRNVLR